MLELCFEGWREEDGNSSGSCCCNCKYHRAIVGHPWNKSLATKSSITTVIGYGCTVPDMPAIVFFEKGHGMCEMHKRREDPTTLRVVK
jgi:hypothetical protein